MRKVASIIGQGVLGTLFFFIFIFNFFSGIVGGIWLLCIGYWRLVLGGVLVSLFMPYWWVIVSLPSLGLILLISFFEEKKSKIGTTIVGLIAGLYDSFLIIGWIAIVFIYALMAVWEREVTLFPMMLFAYSVATSPLIYMASKEPPDSENTNLTISIVVIGSILMAILSLFYVPLIYPLIILGVLMLLRTLLLTVLAVSMIPKKETDCFPDICTRSEGEDEYEGYDEDEYYDNPDDYTPNAYGYTGTENDKDIHEMDIIEDQKSKDPMIEAQKSCLKELLTKNLTRAERLIVVLYYHDEMTFREIAAKLNLTESKVLQMHAAIIARLKANMDDR